MDVAAILNKTKWFNTQEAGTAALALGTYLEKTGGGGQGFTAAVSAPGSAPVTVDDGSPVLLTGKDTPLDAEGRALPVTVSVSKGSAYAVYSLRGTPAYAPAPMSEGLSISRIWKDASGKEIDLDQGAVLKKGDRVTVTLSIMAERPVSDVALSDLLPGGMEVENPRLNTAAAAAGEDDHEDGGVFMDLREDRLLVFFDRLEARKPRTYTYSLRAVSSGTFLLPPLAANAMYAPECSAVTHTGELVVE